MEIEYNDKLEELLPSYIEKFVVTTRGFYNYVGFSDFQNERQLSETIPGKKVSILGSSLDLVPENRLVQDGAEEVNCIDASLLCGPSWTRLKTVVPGKEFRVEYVKRSSILSNSWQYMNIEEFAESQRKRFKNHPDQLKLIGSFIPPIPSEIQEQDYIWDVFGPIHYCEEYDEKFEVIIELIKRLRSGGKLFIAPWPFHSPEDMLNTPEVQEMIYSGGLRTNIQDSVDGELPLYASFEKI